MDPSSKIFIAQNSEPLQILNDNIIENQKINMNINERDNDKELKMKEQIAVDITFQDRSSPRQFSDLKTDISFFLKKFREAIPTSLMVHYFLIYLVEIIIYLQSLSFHASNLKWLAVLINSFLFPIRISLYKFMIYMFNNVYRSKSTLREKFLIPFMTMSFELYVQNCIFYYMLRDLSAINWTLLSISIYFSEAVILFTYTSAYQKLRRYINNLKFLRRSKISFETDDDKLVDTKNTTPREEVEYHQKKSAVWLLRCIWIGKMMSLTQTLFLYLLYVSIYHHHFS